LKPSTLLRPQTAIKKINRKPNEINGLAGHPYASARSPTVTFDNENKSTPSKSQVSRLCGELDERVGAFLNRPIEGDWPTFGSTPPA